MIADVIAIGAAAGLSLGVIVGVLRPARDNRELLDHMRQGAELGAIGGTMVGLVTAVLDALLPAN